MSRPLRRPVADGWYHVFGRGIERRDIYSTERDRKHFLELLAQLPERYRFRIHAYVLLDNHYHAVIQTPEANLSAGMQWFHGSYSAWYNAKHDRVGPLFQGRFRAIPVEDGAWAFTLSLYVHLNPLRVAGLGLDKRGQVLEARGYRKPTAEQVTERLRRLRRFVWSSYRAYAGYAEAPPWLETAVLSERVHRDVGRRAAAYRQAVRRALSQGVEPDVVERLRDAVAIGNAGFAQAMRRLAPADVGEGVTGKRALCRRASVDQIRQAVERLKGEPWDAFAARYGDCGCALFLWGVRRLAGLTLREAGRQAGGMRVPTVSTAIRRFERQAETDARFRRLQDQLRKMTNE